MPSALIDRLQLTNIYLAYPLGDQVLDENDGNTRLGFMLNEIAKSDIIDDVSKKK